MINLDKVLHLVVGFVIASVFAWYSVMFAVVAVVVVAVGKEVWDYLGNGTPDGSDVVATCVGGLLGVVIWL